MLQDLYCIPLWRTCVELSQFGLWYLYQLHNCSLFGKGIIDDVSSKLDSQHLIPQELPADILTIWMTDNLGRKLSGFSSLAISGISMIISGLVIGNFRKSENQNHLHHIFPEYQFRLPNGSPHLSHGWAIFRIRRIQHRFCWNSSFED